MEGDGDDDDDDDCGDVVVDQGMDSFSWSHQEVLGTAFSGGGNVHRYVSRAPNGNVSIFVRPNCTNDDRRGDTVIVWEDSGCNISSTSKSRTLGLVYTVHSSELPTILGRQVAQRVVSPEEVCSSQLLSSL